MVGLTCARCKLPLNLTKASSSSSMQEGSTFKYKETKSLKCFTCKVKPKGYNILKTKGHDKVMIDFKLTI
jgi:hypothetical protein